MDVAASSLSQIRDYLNRRKRVPRQVIDALAADPRTGVRSQLNHWLKRREKELAERRRVKRILALEQELWASGLTYIAGVDEVGVGPLAGPVVAAAVVFPPGTRIPEVDDSKRLDAAQRDDLEVQIREAATAVGFGIAEVDEIDRLNVYHAALQAMRRAVLDLALEPEQILVDAREIPDLPYPQRAVTGGDRRHFSIAAASILAKTHRDRLMLDLDGRYPGYGFAQHKGYCTPEHQRAIQNNGPCKAHRRSYTFVQELAGECSQAYFALKEKLELESSAEELAAVRWEVRAAAALSPQERRKLQQQLSRRQKKYPPPKQLTLL